VGKSVMAGMLAATLSVLRRHPTTLIDTDDTKDVSGWLATRQRDWPALPPIHGVHATEEVGELACQARDRGHDVVLDVGGRDSEQLRVAMSVADILLMPIQPSQFDLFSCKRMAGRVREVRRWNPALRAVFFVNVAEHHAGLQYLNEQAAELCRSFAPTVETATTWITRSVSFGHAAASGRGILEIKSAEKSADQFWALLLELDPTLSLDAEVAHGETHLPS
jgi:chromosome partitioning protein